MATRTTLVITCLVFPGISMAMEEPSENAAHSSVRLWPNLEVKYQKLIAEQVMGRWERLIQPKENKIKLTA